MLKAVFFMGTCVVFPSVAASLQKVRKQIQCLDIYRIIIWRISPVLRKKQKNKKTPTQSTRLFKNSSQREMFVSCSLSKLTVKTVQNHSFNHSVISVMQPKI